MITYEEDWDEDSMPCPCQKCGDWFDQYDGYRSDKWYPNTIICATCSADEQQEIELDNEIDDLKVELENANYDVKRCTERLEEIYKTYKPEE